ncbi:MAG: glycosyltransferase family 2 protein [Pseudomonadota bacterium]
MNASIGERPRISLIVPVYNEEESLPPLLAEVDSALREQGSREVILINDGSTDGSLGVMERLRRDHPGLNIRIICLDRNHGLTAAMDAGFRAARGELLVTIDADLQNDPADIPKLLAYLSRYDVAIGSRTRRRDRFVKRWSSKIANAIRNWATAEDIVDVACSLKTYRAEYVQRLKLYKGLHRFLPTLLKLEGARVIEVPVNHRPRQYGTAKYHLLNRLVGPLLDLFAVRWMQKRHLSYRMEEK